MYNATVKYETRKGHEKTASFMLDAKSPQAAERQASRLVKENGQRRVKSILDVTIEEKRRGLLARLFGRG